MIHCIYGAIMLACSQTATISVDGPVLYAATYPAAGAWNYAVYARPILQPAPTVILPSRRA